MTGDDATSAGRADDGMAHLQAAAKEMISAARALLDAAEQLVEDPSAVGNVVSMVTSFAQAASGTAPPSSSDTTADDGDGREGVERIVVS